VTRPKLYENQDGTGAPVLSVRLSPEVYAHIKKKGGGAYVRMLCDRDMFEHPAHINYTNPLPAIVFPEAYRPRLLPDPPPVETEESDDNA